MKQRIFISHSNDNPIASDLIRTLVSELETAGFQVLVDIDGFKAGDEWRDEIYSWLGFCHGGIILLGPEALDPQRPWVAREAAILTWRKTLCPDFLVMPVLLPGVTTDHLRTDIQFRDLRLETYQAIAYDNADDTVAAVLDGLSEFRQGGKPPLEEVADQVEILLDGIRQAALEKALDTLNADYKAITSHRSTAAALATAMLQAPLAKAVSALETLVSFAPDTSAIDRIFEIIAPNWVDLDAAGWIARCALMKDDKPAVALNAQTQFAAEMYVRRAACKPPKTCWHLVPITAVFGESAFDDIAHEIWQALHISFANFLLMDPFQANDLDQQLTDLLQDLHQRGRPVVVVCRLPPNAGEMILRLRERYPYLQFLFMSGNELPDAQNYQETVLRLITPALPEGKEQTARKEYTTARAILRHGG